MTSIILRYYVDILRIISLILLFRRSPIFFLRLISDFAKTGVVPSQISGKKNVTGMRQITSVFAFLHMLLNIILKILISRFVYVLSLASINSDVVKKRKPLLLNNKNDDLDVIIKKDYVSLRRIA